MLAIVCFPQKNTEDEIRELVLNCLIHLQSQVQAVAAFLFLCSKHLHSICQYFKLNKSISYIIARFWVFLVVCTEILDKILTGQN